MQEGDFLYLGGRVVLVHVVSPGPRDDLGQRTVTFTLSNGTSRTFLRGAMLWVQVTPPGRSSD